MNKRNISRIDSNHTHCWTVRIRENNIKGVNKCFSDGVYGSKQKSLKAAILFRDKILNSLPKQIITKHKIRSWPMFRSKGYFIKKVKRDYGFYYAYIAYCHDKFNDITETKYFGFKTLGKKEARKQAIAWRNKKRQLVEAKARTLGLEPAWK